MEKQQRDFKGIWIPANIWLSKELTLQEKVFLVEINSLNGEDGCFATNDYFANFFGYSKGRCSQIISSLEDKSYIKVIMRMNGKRIIGRKIVTLSHDEGVVNILKRGSKLSKDYTKSLKTLSINNTKNNNVLACAKVDAEIFFKEDKITPKLFPTFWALYPNKNSGKGVAMSAWEKLCNQKNKEDVRPTWQAIRMALRKQKRTERWQNPQFIPLATTWLNQYRWLDDPETMLIPKKRGRAGSGYNGKKIIEYKSAEKV